jgi:hypothetical protein
VLVGHQRYFMFLTGIAIVGVLAVIWLLRNLESKN